MASAIAWVSVPVWVNVLVIVAAVGAIGYGFWAKAKNKGDGKDTEKK